MKYLAIILILFATSSCSYLGVIGTIYKEITGSGASLHYTDQVDVCSDDSCVLEEGSNLTVLYCNKCRVDKDGLETVFNNKNSAKNKK